MKVKLLKLFLSFSMLLSVFTYQVVDAKALVETEYDLIELDRNTSTGTVPGENILVNGDFESGNTGWNTKNGAYVSNWKEEGGVGNGYNQSDYYGVLSVDETDCNFWQQVSVKANTDYVVKAKVMVGKEGGQCILAAKYNWLGNTIAQTAINYDASFAWVYQDVELRFNTGDHTTIEIAAMKWTDDPNSGVAKSQVHVDNIELCELVEGDGTEVGLLQNGDFTSKTGWATTGDGLINDTLKGNGDNTGFLPSWSGNASVYQHVTLKPNTNYTIKADVCIAKEGAYGFLAVKTPTVENLSPAIEKTITCTSAQAWNWQQVELEFNSGNNTAVTICFLKWIDNAERNESNATFMSQMYIDNIELIEGETTSVEEDENYEIIWADDFNNESLDTDKWGYELGSIRGVEQQHYVNDEENVYLKDGKLVLEVTDRNEADQYTNPRGTRKVIYNSGSVRTHGLSEFLYGRIEIKAKLPYGQGVFPAFWTLGADFPLDGRINGAQGDGWPVSGEIDIMELIGTASKESWNNRTVWQTLHYAAVSGNDNGKYAGNGTSYTIDEAFYNDYHVFGINWSKGKIEWYVDDQIVRTVDYSDDPQALISIDRPQYIQMNLACGGNWPGDAGNDLAGQQFVIDYVYYGVNEQQKADREAYYAQTVSFEGLEDLTMVVGTTPDLLENITLAAGSESVNVEEYTIDYSIEDEHMFASYEDALANTADDPSDNMTAVSLLVKDKNDVEALKNLAPGQYNVHYSAMHENKPSVRKTVVLTVLGLANYELVDEMVKEYEYMLQYKDMFTESSWQAYEDAYNAVVYGLDETHQEEVQQMASAIYVANSNLEYVADYTVVDEAIAKVPADLTIYTEESVNALQEALNNVVRGLGETKQEEVNAFAKAIEDALAALVENVVTPDQPTQTGDISVIAPYAILTISSAALFVSLNKKED